MSLPSVGRFRIADGQASYCLVRERRRRRRRCRYRASTSMRFAKICRRVSDTLLFLYKFFISLHLPTCIHVRLCDYRNEERSSSTMHTRNADIIPLTLDQYF